MDPNEIRKAIQAALKEKLGITDVAFTPLAQGVEMISFYEPRQPERAHIAFPYEEYGHNIDLLKSHVVSAAMLALVTAKDRAAHERIKKAAEAEEEAAKNARLAKRQADQEIINQRIRDARGG